MNLVFKYLSFIVAYLLLPFLSRGQNLSSTETTSKTLLKEEIYFDFGKHDIRPDDLNKLEEVFKLLLTQDYLQIKITAHTDAIGSTESNQQLSARRGEAIQTYLIAKGIPDSLMQVGLYGEEAPVADNTTDDGRQLNRRATIEVLQAPLTEKVHQGLIEGTVIDKVTGTPIEATVIIRSKSFRDSMHTDSTGYFQKQVPINTVVGIDVYAPGYFFETQMMKVLPKKVQKPISVELPQAKAGETAQIKDLFFVGNQAVLLPKSKPTLPKVLRFMQINKNLKVEIGGHVNFPYNHSAYRRKAGEFEQTLSDNRAKLVYDYLITNDINPERLSWKGYSNTQMKFPYAKRESEMWQNRRVEILVLE